MSDFAPRLGHAVALEIIEGLVVRHEKTGRRLKTGDHVTWSTYYARRQRDGALVPREIVAKKSAETVLAKRPSSVSSAEESS